MFLSVVNMHKLT